MLEEKTQVITSHKEIKDVSDLKVNDNLMCDDGTSARIIEIFEDVQPVYEIYQKTKHRANTGEPGRRDPLRKKIYQRLVLECGAAHKIRLRTSAIPQLVTNSKKDNCTVCWKDMRQMVTQDGRILDVPKIHHKNFPKSSEGIQAAQYFMSGITSQMGSYLYYDMQVMDLEYLDPHVRVTSYMEFHPVTKGNGIISKHLTGQKGLITPKVLGMAWMLGLWIGDGTTKEPEISMDSSDTELIAGLIEISSQWGIFPAFKDEFVPLRAKHVRLYYGNGLDENRKTRQLRKNNPFWNTITSLKFKRDTDGVKDVPEFLWNEDVEIREAFLAGLIDSDGYVVTRNSSSTPQFKVSIQTVYSTVMNAVAHIARSLGISVTITTRSARSEKIEDRTVQCRFTYDCCISGGAPLQKVLSLCHSKTKRRPDPGPFIRKPVYFGFDVKHKGPSKMVGIKLDASKPIMLANKMVSLPCTEACKVDHDIPYVNPRIKQCIACPRRGVRYFYKDWTGESSVCGRCYARYKFSGHRCLNCKYVPDSREVKKARMLGEKVGITPDGVMTQGYPCSSCGGILIFDAIRGPRKESRIALEAC